VPLTEVDELRAEEELERRRSLGRMVIGALVIVIACTGLQIWMIGSTREIADDARIQVAEVRATQAEIQATQRAGIIRGLKLRAVACRSIELAGGTFRPGDVCLEEEVQPFFRPSASG
jgi:hypothetical protein